MPLYSEHIGVISKSHPLSCWEAAVSALIGHKSRRLQDRVTLHCTLHAADKLHNETAGGAPKLPAGYLLHGGNRFRSGLTDRLSSLMCFVFSSVPSGKFRDSRLPQIRPRPLPSISFPTYYSLIILPFDTTQSELLTVSLHKLQGGLKKFTELLELGHNAALHAWITY
jgi:hypothetical protein